MALLSGDVGRKRPWLYSRTHSSAVTGGLHNERSNQESINVAESSLNCWFVRFTSHPTLITLRGSINYCRSNRFNWYLFAIRRYRSQKCFSLFKYFCLISNRQDSFDFFPARWHMMMGTSLTFIITQFSRNTFMITMAIYVPPPSADVKWSIKFGVVYIDRHPRQIN